CRWDISGYAGPWVLSPRWPHPCNLLVNPWAERVVPGTLPEQLLVVPQLAFCRPLRRNVLSKGHSGAGRFRLDRACSCDEARQQMSVDANVRYWHKADIPRPARRCPLSGVKRTYPQMTDCL